MKIERKLNAKKNIKFGILFKLYQIVIPFIMRTIMIHQMGMEYAGLNNLFASLLQVLNLADLGIGAALTVSMYKPIADDDEKQVCALLKLYRKCFFIIGAVILGIGLACLPFLRSLVKGDVPDNLNLYYLFLMYLFNSVASYWLFSYKKGLFFAHQRNDIISKVMICTLSFQFVTQAIILFTLKNYYVYLLFSIIAQVMQNLICAFISRKMYPQYVPNGQVAPDLLKEITKKVRGLIVNKFGSTILRSADSIVISAFLGLTILAVYQNYYFVLTAIISLFAIVYESLLAGVGNSLVTETPSKNYHDFVNVTYIIGGLICGCCCCFVGMFQPFIEIWVGTEFLMEMPLVFCLVAYFFLFEIDQLIGMYKDAAGIWYSDRFRPLISAIANLSLNILLVRFIGLYGVLLSTVIALFILDIPWLIRNTFKNVFDNMPCKKYYCLLLRIVCYTCVCVIVTHIICIQICINVYVDLLVRGIISVIVPVVIILVGEHRREQFRLAKSTVNSVLKRKKHQKKQSSME